MSTKNKLAIVAATLVTGFSSSAFAQTVAKAATVKEDVYSFAAMAAGFAIAIAALGGTLAQGRATAAALEGISRNPGAAAKIQTPMILGLALIESLVLFAFVIAFLLQKQIGAGW
jgi:F-type H+-transporting ATPase subunit c